MYDRVIQLCEEFPDLHFTLNGGITKLDHLKSILERFSPSFSLKFHFGQGKSHTRTHTGTGTGVFIFLEILSEGTTTCC